MSRYYWLIDNKCIAIEKKLEFATKLDTNFIRVNEYINHKRVIVGECRNVERPITKFFTQIRIQIKGGSKNPTSKYRSTLIKGLNDSIMHLNELFAAEVWLAKILSLFSPRKAAPKNPIGQFLEWYFFGFFFSALHLF